MAESTEARFEQRSLPEAATIDVQSRRTTVRKGERRQLWDTGSSSFFYEVYKAGKGGKGKDKKEKCNKKGEGKGKGKGKEKSNKSDGYETCSPSSMPSMNPTVSIYPTSSPTMHPTASPSASPTSSPSVSPSHPPSNVPTASPSVSQVPTLSLSPSESPTSFPSISPSSKPSMSPSESPSGLPSATPTLAPSVSPTHPPTLTPSVSPTGVPTASPTTGAPSASPTDVPTFSPSVFPSGLPSVLPSSVPTLTPSISPSDLPSLSPSSRPSSLPSISPTMSPSVSAAPSILNYGVAKNETDGSYTSSCNQGPPVNFTARTAEFLFQYTMYLDAGAGPNGVIPDVEAALHNSTAFRFMPCLYVGTSSRRLQQAQALQFTDLSSLPTDALSTSIACTTAEQRAGQDCYVVDAGFTPTYITFDTSDAVAEEVGTFLSETMDGGSLNDSNQNLTGLVFRGFTKIPTDAEQTADDRGDDERVAGAGSQEGAVDTTRSAMIGGASAITIAVLGALVVVFLVARKKRREEMYMKHLEDDSVLSIGGARTNDSSGGKGSRSGSDEEPTRAIILGDEELLGADDDAEEYGFETLQEDEWNHDPTTCQSVTCEICQSEKMKRPTFVRAELEAQIQEDLGPKRNLSPDRLYYSPNTVDL